MENEDNMVFVVQVDNTKDLSDAKRYGSLQAVFSRPRRPYDTGSMLSRARRVLSDWKPGDHLLMIGDPVLCAVCMSVVSEHEEVVNVLSWDRDSFQYAPQRWDFGQMELFDAVDDED
jgi:hypothetical protein